MRRQGGPLLRFQQRRIGIYSSALLSRERSPSGGTMLWGANLGWARADQNSPSEPVVELCGSCLFSGRLQRALRGRVFRGGAVPIDRAS